MDDTWTLFKNIKLLLVMKKNIKKGHNCREKIPVILWNERMLIKFSEFYFTSCVTFLESVVSSSN